MNEIRELQPVLEYSQWRNFSAVIGMKRGNSYIVSRPVEQPPEGEFAATPYDYYEELRNHLIELIPNLKMRMKIDPRTNRPEFSTDVQSVFDIA